MFSWGDGTLGALGHGNRATVSTPAIVRTLLESNVSVAQLAGGFGHSVAVCCTLLSISCECALFLLLTRMCS